MRSLLMLSFVLMAGMASAEDADEANAVDEAKIAQCEALGGIVTQLVELRQDGKREARAVRTLTKGKSAVEERYQPVVQFLSGWVYSLTKDELNFEPGVKYEESCLAQ